MARQCSGSRNILHSASVVCKGKRILVKDLPDTFSSLDKSTPSEYHTDSSKKVVDVNIQNENLDSGNLQEANLSESDTFGKGKHDESQIDKLVPPPSSISLKESYDIAYAHTRKLTDSNLLELVEREMIQEVSPSVGKSGESIGLAGHYSGYFKKTHRYLRHSILNFNNLPSCHMIEMMHSKLFLFFKTWNWIES